MILCKFGGSSISKSTNISQVKEILKTKIKNKTLVVFSAIDKTTNQLIKCGEYASNQNNEYIQIIESIINQHNEIINFLIPKSEKIIKLIEDVYNQIRNICLGIYYLKELSNKIKDYLISNGEILSGLIIYEYLRLEFTEYNIKYYNSFDFIVTDSHFGKANIIHLKTENNIKKIKNDNFDLAVCSGFIAQNDFNEITTVGRGGGDYTAALYGAYLDCQYVEIWTDVNGIMTSDPKIIKNAKTIKYLTYNEMMELSHYGANIIYAPTIIPLYKKNIPIYVRNTFNPTFVGTEISNSNLESTNLATAISKMNNIILMKIYGNYLIGRIGFSNKLFSCLSENNVNIILISQSSCEYSIYLVINRDDLITTENKLNELYQEQINNKELSIVFFNDKSLLAIETNNSRNITYLMLKIYTIFTKNNTNIYTQTTSDHNISVVLDKENVDEIQVLIYNEIFEYIE